MDIKINGNLYLQNEYQTGNIKSQDVTSRKAVLKRNEGAFKAVAEYYYDKTGMYDATGNSMVKENSDIITEETKKASMAECMDTLKNLVTPEDYSQLEAWGLIPDEDNPEAFVSVYERIQIELAAYCEDYDISNLNINKNKMKEVLGSEAMAAAVSRAEDIGEAGSVLSDDAKKYILENKLQPTIDNVYKAVYSGKSSAEAKELSDDQWKQLSPQVEKFFETNGIENSSENMDRAKWIISENLPLNVENMTTLIQMDGVNFDDASYMEKLSQDISYNIYFGGDGMTTDITGKGYDMEAVNEAVKTVNSAIDEDVEYIVKNNYKLNIENLKLRIEERNKKQQENIQADKIINEEALASQSEKNKILSEARAVLTAGSLFMMQKAGIKINFTELTVLIEVSAAKNNTFAESVFMLDGTVATDEEKNILTDTLQVMRGFSEIPVSVAGKIYTGQTEYTPEAVYEEGQKLAEKYRMAEKSYEALGTEVRSDLGDSIDKAFRNIDDILNDQSIEVNDENRRAARVLSYNTTEITAESVQAVTGILDELDSLTKNLTPRAAVYLIKNGINPLNTRIDRLNDKLKEINETLEADDEDEKYSEFLWKLEKSKDITAEERDAYIQRYRVLEHINRQDGRAAGAVSKAGQEMTLSNMYSAVKTIKLKSVDKKVDDQFGLLESGYNKDDLTAYMEKFTSIAEDETLHGEYKYQRFREKMESFMGTQTITEHELAQMVTGMESTSVNNIYSAMIASDPGFYKMMKSLDDEKLLEESDKISEMWQSEDDLSEEEVVKAYNNLNKVADTKNTEGTFERAVLKNDIKQAISFMARQADSRSYYVPMEISGDTTIVHMTFKQGDQSQKGRISIYSETAAGRISVLMCRKNDTYNIYAAADSEELKEKLEELMETEVVISDAVNEGMWNDVTEDNSEETYEVTYGELVKQAKAFINNVLKRI